MFQRCLNFSKWVFSDALKPHSRGCFRNQAVSSRSFYSINSYRPASISFLYPSQPVFSPPANHTRARPLPLISCFSSSSVETILPRHSSRETRIFPTFSPPRPINLNVSSCSQPRGYAIPHTMPLFPSVASLWEIGRFFFERPRSKEKKYEIMVLKCLERE